KGVSPNIITYGILINGLCKDGKLEDAKNILNELPSKGLQPDCQVMTYNIIIHCLLKNKDVYKAMPFLEDMHKRGFSVDAATSLMLINDMQGSDKDDILLK
ncbi:hypothetical protein MIMGU_mgv1a025192mg, partial [Erythranthe guttata]